MTGATVPVLTVVIAVILLGSVGGLRRGVLIGPLGLATFMLVAIFGLRPLLMLERSSYDFYGLRVVDGFGTATWIGLVSVIALFAGYGAHVVRRGSDAQRVRRTRPEGPPARASARPVSVLAGALACVLLVLAWFALVAAYGGGGGFLTLMFSGRSAQVNARLEGLPAVVMALPVVGVLVLAVVRVVVERAKRLAVGERVLFWAAMLFAIVPTTALGTRRFLLPVVLAAVVAASAPAWRRRVRPGHLAMAGVGLLALAVVPFVRSAGSRTGDASLAGAMQDYYVTEGPATVLENFLLSYDTEMFSYVSYAAPRLGTDLPLGLGRGTVLELLIAPLPSGVLGVESWSNERLRAIFGGSCAEYLCPVPSLPGALYLDFALPGVIIGMLVFGWFVRASERSLPNAQGASLVLVVGFISFVPNIVRGNPASQLAILAQVVVLAMVVLWSLRLVSRATSWHRTVQGAGQTIHAPGERPTPGGVPSTNPHGAVAPTASNRGATS